MNPIGFFFLGRHSFFLFQGKKKECRKLKKLNISNSTKYIINVTIIKRLSALQLEHRKSLKGQTGNIFDSFVQLLQEI